MNKKKYAFFITLIMVLTLFIVLNACNMGYAGDVVNAAQPVIDEQPKNVSAVINETVTLSVTVSIPKGAFSDLTYQWYKFVTFRDYVNQAGEMIYGADQSTYTPSTKVEGETNYYVVVTNSNPKANGLKVSSVKSDPIKVAVADSKNAKFPIITQQPSYEGGSVIWSLRLVPPTFEVIAEADPSDEIRYQWFVSDTLNNSYGTPIEGAVNSRLIPPVVVEGAEDTEGKITGPGNYYYFAVVTNYYFAASGRRESSVASSPVFLNVAVNPDADTPVITKQPASAIYFSGEEVKELSVEADEPADGGTLSYQWYSNTTSSNTGGTIISGAKDDTLALTISTTTIKQYYYYVVVTNTNTAATNPVKTTTSRVAEISVATPSTKTANATFTVQTGGDRQCQFVRGFGGMDVAWGNFPDYSVEDYENMFNPDILGYNMIRLMILPTNTDINKTLDSLISNQLYTSMDRSRFYENVKTVNRYGGYVLASPWSPPAAWKTNNSINGGGDLRASNYVDFAYYLRAFAQNMLSHGAPIYAISISNEPNYTAGYDGCEWTSQQMRDFYERVGRFTVEGPQGTLKVMYPNTIQGYGGGKIQEYVRTMNGESANTTTINENAMGTSAAKKNIDILARHNYGVRNENGAGTGTTSGNNWIYHPSDPREIWMTEHNLNSNSGTTYPNDHTWNYIWLFMNDVDMTIRINHEAAFIWWSAKRFYSMIGDGTYGCRDGEILPRGWGLAHYSKFAKESYRANVAVAGTTKTGVTLNSGNNGNVNGNVTDNFTSTTVKVSSFIKLKGGEIFPVNWRSQTVNVANMEEINLVMFTPTSQDGTGGIDMGTVKIQLPAGFKISSATAMRSDPEIFDRDVKPGVAGSGSNRGTPKWENVEISQDRNSAFVELPRSTILSVRFTQ